MGYSETVQSIRAEGWLTIEDPDMSMEDAIQLLHSLGNVILELDPEHRRIKVLDIYINQESADAEHGSTG